MGKQRIHEFGHSGFLGLPKPGAWGAESRQALGGLLCLVAFSLEALLGMAWLQSQGARAERSGARSRLAAWSSPRGFRGSWRIVAGRRSGRET